jgi:hypothetical protein
MILWSQGCSPGEEEQNDGPPVDDTTRDDGRNASEAAEASVLEASTEALDSEFDASNLVICAGARVPFPESYDDDASLEKHNNCEDPTLAGIYAREWNMKQWKRYGQAFQSFPETADFVEVVQHIPDAVACAIKCKEHASCSRFQWHDPAYYNDDHWRCPVLRDCPAYIGMAKVCILWAAPGCKTKTGDLLSPVVHYDDGPPYPIVEGRIIAGLQPGDDGTSGWTECKYGKRIETR